MRIFIVIIAASIVVACSDADDDRAPKVCNELLSCLSSGTWITDVESIYKGKLIPAAGSRGVITFNKDRTGTTTETFLQGYADGKYYSTFTYELDESKFTLTISYDIPQSNPTQSEVFAITSAYENEIHMEIPMVDGKLIFILTK
jgi:hypothetical protein